MDKFSDLDNLAEYGLTVSYLCNAISHRIVGVGWFMSSRIVVQDLSSAWEHSLFKFES
jgi:hypothetical protein